MAHDDDHDHDEDTHDHDGDPRQVELQRRLDEGWHAVERGDTDAALALARQIAADTGAPDALLLEAACLRETGDADGAVAALQRTIKADPEWATPELWLAELLAAQPEATVKALDHASRALDLAEEEDEYLNALALKAGLEAELGNLDAARETLEDLPAPDVVLDDSMLALEIAELCLAVGDPAGARDRLLALTRAEPRLADGWYTLGMAAEALGDDAAMRRAWTRAWELDAAAQGSDSDESDGGAGGEPDQRIDEKELAAIAEQALAELPARARQLLENVPIIIAELPARADVESGLDPRLLGLFSGTPLPEASNLGGQPGLTQIILFRRNLERAAETEDELRDEIRTTLLHETGHFFGLDEDELERMGLD
jgi:predicted Zn-dependent protease with MMP-like domain